MKIGIFSDVHDNLNNLNKAILCFHNHGIQRLIFCGDFCSPLAAKSMANFSGSIDCVFGNNDGDRFAISKISASQPKNLILHGEYAEIIIKKARIAITHYPIYGKAMAHTREYDLVCSGHTHFFHQEKINSTIWINPGEVAGILNKPTIVLFDTILKTSAVIEIS